MIFGLFKKKDSDREWALKEINRLKGLIDRSDRPQKIAFGMTLAMHWNTFDAAQGGISVFDDLPRDEQMEHVKKWIALSERLRAERVDPTALVAAEFLIHLLSAVIMKDRAISLDLLSYLEPYLVDGRKYV